MDRTCNPDIISNSSNSRSNRNNRNNRNSSKPSSSSSMGTLLHSPRPSLSPIHSSHISRIRSLRVILHISTRSKPAIDRRTTRNPPHLCIGKENDCEGALRYVLALGTCILMLVEPSIFYSFHVELTCALGKTTVAHLVLRMINTTSNSNSNSNSSSSSSNSMLRCGLAT